MYYRDAHAILIAFSLASNPSFVTLSSWIDEVNKSASKANALKVIVGLKSDLIDEKEVSFKMA